VVDVRGVTVTPEVYVAVGIRGDTFHNAAIEGAKFILAIHPDSDAPIFQVADLCLETDPEEVLPALLEALSEGEKRTGRRAASPCCRDWRARHLSGAGLSIS
jgi:electron transfer flavoprotein alpha subunit